MQNPNLKVIARPPCGGVYFTDNKKNAAGLPIYPKIYQRHGKATCNKAIKDFTELSAGGIISVNTQDNHTYVFANMTAFYAGAKNGKII